MLPAAQVCRRRRRLVLRPSRQIPEGHASRVAFSSAAAPRLAPTARHSTSNSRFHVAPSHHCRSARPAHSCWRSHRRISFALRQASRAQARRHRRPPPAGVSIQTLAAKPFRRASDFIATLRSLRSTTVQPEVEGIVTRIFVKAGDRVRAGTPLVQINPQRQQAAVRSAEANRVGTERTSSTGGSRSSGSSRCSGPARSAGRSSIRRRTRCGRPKRGWRRSTRRCAKATYSSASTA